jgi:hypothetical protein
MVMDMATGAPAVPPVDTTVTVAAIPARRSLATSTVSNTTSSGIPITSSAEQVSSSFQTVSTPTPATTPAPATTSAPVTTSFVSYGYGYGSSTTTSSCTSSYGYGYSSCTLNDQPASVYTQVASNEPSGTVVTDPMDPVTVTPSDDAAPEPSSSALFLAGLAAVYGAMRFRRQRGTPRTGNPQV